MNSTESELRWTSSSSHPDDVEHYKDSHAD